MEEVEQFEENLSIYKRFKALERIFNMVELSEHHREIFFNDMFQLTPKWENMNKKGRI